LNLTSLFSFYYCAGHSARFATVMFMFRHRGRVRVALGEQDMAAGAVDRLFEEAIAAGAEDFDQAPKTKTGQDVEVEVKRSVSSASSLQ
jgi:transcriptional/translational regulatory protein YebC/TACO1